MNQNLLEIIKNKFSLVYGRNNMKDTHIPEFRKQLVPGRDTSFEISKKNDKSANPHPGL